MAQEPTSTPPEPEEIYSPSQLPTLLDNEKKSKLILSILVFGASLVTYLLTVAPTVSFWDCGEFIACANILGVPHPPGTPFFMLLGRAFIIMFSFFEDIAYRVNLLSVLSSAAGVMFVFLFTEKLLVHILKSGRSSIITYTGGLVAAFLVNFSDTYWFNAVEAEVYGIAMFLVVLISWLSLVWVENKETPKGDRMLLLICYLAFLGIGFHLYTVMTLPAIFVLILMVNPRSRTDWPMIVTGVGLISVVYMVGSFLTIAGVLLAVWATAYLMATSHGLKKQFNLSMWFCIVALAGYSTHAYIPIRSALNPRIDENNPETWETYKGFVERKQYGSEGMLKRAMHRRGHIANQVLSHPHMGYGGYMLAQYLPWKVGEGRSSIVDNKYKGKPQFAAEENDPVVRWGMKFPAQMNFMPPYTHRHWQFMLFVLFHIPMLWGGYLAYKRNKPFGAYILLLYFLASAGLIFYMNFSDGIRPDLGPYNQWISQGANPSQPPPNVHMEVRERDYFYAPGYMFMGILFGISAAFLMLRIRGRDGARAGISRIVGAGLILVSIVVPCFSNYSEHDRSKVWVPYDYARNLLMSCRPHSILFTNGDNDTFPLWFMQEVENVRKDVRVVNLSLANTDWYIHQILEVEPTLVLGFNHEQIKTLRPRINELAAPVEHKLGKTGLVVTLEGKDKKPYYKVQDILVMNIVTNNWPKRPVHFAVTVSSPNMMGLGKYMLMEGMVYTLTSEIHNQQLEPVRTAYLADSVYWYRELGRPDMYLNNDTKGLLSNYFATNHRLARWAQEKITALDSEKQKLEAEMADTASAADDSLKTAKQERLKEIEAERAEKYAFAERYIHKTGKLMPWDWRHYYFSSQFYRAVKEFGTAESLLTEGLALEKQKQAFNMQLGQLYGDQGAYDKAEVLYREAAEENREDFQIVYALSETLEKQQKFTDAKEALAAWLTANANHQYAQFISRRIQELEKKISTAPPQMPVIEGKLQEKAPEEKPEESGETKTEE